MPHAHTIEANPHWLPLNTRRSLSHIPGHRGWPVVGNTLEVLKDPLEYHRRMNERHGPVYRSNTLGAESVVLLGPDANELVLFDKERNFSSEQGWGPYLNLLFPRGLMLMDFEKHRTDRKALSVAFKPEPMRHYAARFDRGVAAALPRWAGRSIRFYDEIKRLSLDLAADCFLGVPLGLEAQRINKAFVDQLRASVSIIRTPLPGTAMRRGVKAREYLVDYFRREIPARRNDEGQDFFSQFCRATGEDDRLLADEAITDHMNFLMMAAHDTITSSATTLVMMLGRHPWWQERLREEVLSLGRGDDGVPQSELDRMVLTEYAFKEALRIMPPVPSIPRRAMRDFSFGGYHIPAGSFVGVIVTHTHQMAEHWPDPGRFDPMRFAPENAKGRHRFAWVPFGGGAHMCIGLHFATQQIRLLMAHLLRRYRIEPEPSAGEKWSIFPIPRPKDSLPVRMVPLS